MEPPLMGSPPPIGVPYPPSPWGCFGVQKGFLENFVENWIFMYMKDNIKMFVEKLMSSLYKDNGLLEEYSVRVYDRSDGWDFLSKMCNDGHQQCHMVVMDILINYDVWKEMGGESSSIIQMEEKIYSLWRYLPFPFTSITINSDVTIDKSLTRVKTSEKK